MTTTAPAGTGLSGGGVPTRTGLSGGAVAIRTGSGTPAELAEAVAAAVRAVPGVAGLGVGGPIEVATLYPGGKVLGIRLGDPVEVHVRLDRVPVGPVAEAVAEAARAVLTRAGADRAVTVTVEDVETAALAAWARG